MTDSSNPKSKEQDVTPTPEEQLVDPLDLTYQQGTPEHPREVVQNPAVAPQMLDVTDDLRTDLNKED